MAAIKNVSAGDKVTGFTPEYHTLKRKWALLH